LQLLISERHELVISGEERVSDYASARIIQTWRPVQPTDSCRWSNVWTLRPNKLLQPTPRVSS
jgi:hypothetical protein